MGHAERMAIMAEAANLAELIECPVTAYRVLGTERYRLVATNSSLAAEMSHAGYGVIGWVK